jgi:hypothetical protein
MTADAARSVRIFVNAAGVDVPAGASVLDAIRQWNADEAAAVTRGDRVITDSRGLPIASDIRVSAGSIFRVIPNRKRSGSAGADDEVAGGSDD